MKKQIFSLLILSVLLSFLTPPAADAQAGEGEWKWHTLEDFEQCYNFEIINTPYFQSRWKHQNPLLSIIQGAPKDISSSQFCLGARFLMDTLGDTKKYILPINKVEIPGVCRKLSFWVNGRRKAVTLRVIVQDYFNVIHILDPHPLSLDFYGWKKLEVDNVDQKVIQLSSVEPDYRPLKFVGFVVENVFRKVYSEPVYVYFDQLEAYCRVDTLGDYDGSRIPDKW